MGGGIYIHVHCNQSHDIIISTITECKRERDTGEELNTIRRVLTASDRMEVWVNNYNKIRVNRKHLFLIRP